MESDEPAGRRRRRSRRSRAAPPLDSPREPFLSLKPVLQAGSVAAALGSILALFLTVGDRVSVLWSGDSGAPRVHIDRVKLETMSLQTFLVTKKRQEPPFGYTPKELNRDVIVANIDARYERSSRGVPFPARLTLETRASNGRVRAVDRPFELNYTLDASNDTCGCYHWFNLPAHGREYRVEVQILRPSNAPHSEPLADGASDWYRL
jgi:hypothetical protein